jgi:hypothetical protein
MEEKLSKSEYGKKVEEEEDKSVSDISHIVGLIEVSKREGLEAGIDATIIDRMDELLGELKALYSTGPSGWKPTPAFEKCDQCGGYRKT